MFKKSKHITYSLWYADAVALKNLDQLYRYKLFQTLTKKVKLLV